MVDQRATPEQQRDMVERCLKVRNSMHNVLSITLLVFGIYMQ
jgi:hypothetical protein